MVRAADEPATRGLAYLGEHVPTVATRGVEGPQVSRLVPREERGLVAERNSTPGPRATQILRAPYADPALVEEVLHLPIEHRSVRVSLGGQAHLPLRHQRRSHQLAVNRRHLHSPLEPVHLRPSSQHSPPPDGPPACRLPPPTDSSIILFEW